jgi:hypothetical protein
MPFPNKAKKSTDRSQKAVNRYDIFVLSVSKKICLVSVTRMSKSKYRPLQRLGIVTLGKLLQQKREKDKEKKDNQQRQKEEKQKKREKEKVKKKRQKV